MLPCVTRPGSARRAWGRSTAQSSPTTSAVHPPSDSSLPVPTPRPAPAPGLVPAPAHFMHDLTHRCTAGREDAGVWAAE